MIDPQKLQGEVMKWNLKNFPRAFPHQPTLGIVEEIGELMEADALCTSGQDGIAKLCDAVGDVAIYCAVFCGLNGFDLFQLAVKHENDYNLLVDRQDEIRLGFIVVAGKLCHAFLKDEQKIRGHHHRETMSACIGQIMSLLSALCRIYEIDILECIDVAWSEVSQRDWIKYPKTGVPDGLDKFKAHIDKTLREYPIPKSDWGKRTPF
jgi:hypothetical protein